MKSHNYEGMPIMAGLTIVIPNMCFHIMAIACIVKGLGCDWFDFIFTKYGWIAFASVFVGLLYWYYSYHDRYKKIIEHYNNGHDNFFKRHPFVVYIISYICSFILLFISALFYQQAQHKMKACSINTTATPLKRLFPKTICFSGNAAVLSAALKFNFRS